MPAANYIQLPKATSQNLGLTGSHLYLQVKDCHHCYHHCYQLDLIGCFNYRSSCFQANPLSSTLMWQLTAA